MVNKSLKVVSKINKDLDTQIERNTTVKGYDRESYDDENYQFIREDSVI